MNFLELGDNTKQSLPSTVQLAETLTHRVAGRDLDNFSTSTRVVNQFAKSGMSSPENYRTA